MGTLGTEVSSVVSEEDFEDAISKAYRDAVNAGTVFPYSSTPTKGTEVESEPVTKDELIGLLTGLSDILEHGIPLGVALKLIAEELKKE